MSARADMQFAYTYCGLRGRRRQLWPLVVIVTAFLLVTLTAAGPLPKDDDKKTASTPPRKASQQKLLVVLLDGYRWDYPTRKTAYDPFNRIKEKGVMARYLEPVFPTMSFPNYQSLVTGLYPANHGIVMNYMYDEERDAFFKMLPSVDSVRSFWWNQSEPIWIEAAKANLRSRLYGWPGCEVVYNESLTDGVVCEPYRFVEGFDSFQDHVDEGVNKLINDEADLVQIYVEDPDAVGHKNGPDSPEVQESIRKVNVELDMLLDMIEEMNTEKKVTKTTSRKSKYKKKVKVTYTEKVKVNVIVVSDHGMTATDDRHVKRISLDSAVDMRDIKYVLGKGAVVGVHPESDKIDKVYGDLSSLEGIYVWKKSDIPEQYHMNHTNTAPILVLTKKGYFIEAILNSNKQIPYTDYSDADRNKGYHGYDPREVHDMRGIFYAFGPAFEKGKVMPSINMVDVYNIMTHVLDIEPHPNDGTMTKVIKYLKPTSAASSVLFGDSALSSIVVMCLGCLYMYRLKP